MPLQASLTLTPQAAVANGICLSQKPSAGGLQSLTLNGSFVSDGVANLVVPSMVAITSTGNEVAITFTITGTNYQGLTQSESLSGPDVGTVTSANYYLTVTSITVSGNTAGNITVGTNGQATTPWFPMNYGRSPVSSQICDISSGGSLTYTVQFTGDNLQTTNGIIDRYAALNAVAQDHSTLTSQTESNTGILISGVCGLRIVTNAYTSGSVTMSIIQSSATAG